MGDPGDDAPLYGVCQQGEIFLCGRWEALAAVPCVATMETKAHRHVSWLVYNLFCPNRASSNHPILSKPAGVALYCGNAVFISHLGYSWCAWTGATVRWLQEVSEQMALRKTLAAAVPLLETDLGEYIRSQRPPPARIAVDRPSAPKPTASEGEAAAVRGATAERATTGYERHVQLPTGLAGVPTRPSRAALPVGRHQMPQASSTCLLTSDVPATHTHPHTKVHPEPHFHQLHQSIFPRTAPQTFYWFHLNTSNPWPPTCVLSRCSSHMEPSAPEKERETKVIESQLFQGAHALAKQARGFHA